MDVLSLSLSIMSLQILFDWCAIESKDAQRGRTWEMASSSGDVQSHHRHQFSKTTTTMTSMSNNSRQSTGHHASHQHSTGNDSLAIEEQNSALEPHHPVYPVSEWDTKLGRSHSVTVASAASAAKSEQLSTSRLFATAFCLVLVLVFFFFFYFFF